MDKTGYEKIIRNFSARRVTAALQNKGNPRRKQMLERLLGITDEVRELQQTPPLVLEENEEAEDIEIEINKLIKATLEDSNRDMLAANAPAGTGRTFTISMYIAKLLENVKDVILVAAPTNLAIQKVSENVPINDYL